ncbi:MAG: prepilin-type N-terminal cleavage/methylation domain-containing protein [Planctomycetota bacterium]|nr:prepilin-type N-terminal cleavage/methylation domain-containing protein [Planctomycetota bacterium]
MTRRAFTLVELLVCLALLSLAASLALPALARAREGSNQETCTNTLRAILSATGVYAADAKEALPNGANSPWVKGTFIGSNYFTQVIFEPKQVCGVGQLMWGKYLPEKREAIACPQADAREDKGFNTGQSLLSYTSKAPNDAADLCLRVALDPVAPMYYRNVYGTPGFPNYFTTYGIRGPALKLSKPLHRTEDPKSDIVKPADFAFFADFEAADQKLIPKVGDNPSPLLGWGRVHAAGINVAYLDGHVALFADEDRSKTWAAGETRNYGNAFGIFAYDADYKAPAK